MTSPRLLALQEMIMALEEIAPTIYAWALQYGEPIEDEANDSGPAI